MGARDNWSRLGGAHKRIPQWRLLLQYSGGVRKRVVFGGVLTFLGTLIGLSQPLLAQWILAAVTSRRPVVPLLALLTGAVLIGAGLLACGYYLLEYAGETVVLTMRTRLIRRILRLPLGVTHQVPPGDLMSRLVADTTLLRQITTQGLVSASTGVISLIGTLVFMGLIDWVLLLATLTSVVQITLAFRWSARKIGRATGEAQAAVGLMAVLLDRNLGAFRTMKAAGAEPTEIERLSGSAREAWRLGLRLARWQAVSGTTAILALQVSFLVVLGIGGARVAAGAMPISALIAFMLFMLYLNQPINAISTAYNQYQAGTAAAQRVEHVLNLAAEPMEDDPPQPDNEPPPSRPPPSRALLPPHRPPADLRDHLAVWPGPAPDGRARFDWFATYGNGSYGNRTGRNGTGRNGTGRNGTGRNGSYGNGTGRNGADGNRTNGSAQNCASVRFDSVVFGYARDLPKVHRGVTFHVPPGGMTAIVGPSGAGKSTVFALIERFYDVDAGQVRVDGLDVRKWPLGQLRACLGYVEQDAPALAGTVRENLTLGLGKVPDRQLHEVLEAAQLAEFVTQLPGGLDGEIGYRGGTLSGGERQRLAIARGLLRTPRILLLDEATSQLDAANERALRDAVAAAATVTTVIVVAHRLSTVIGARQIVVMEEGVVRNCGTHHELLRTDSVYRNLAATQLLAPPQDLNSPAGETRSPGRANW